MGSCRRLVGLVETHGLEGVAQRELHTAWYGQQRARDSKIASGKPGSDKEWIKPVGVGDVVHLPRELEITVTTEPPIFGQIRIERQVAVPAESIAFSRFPRIGQAHGRAVVHTTINCV